MRPQSIAVLGLLGLTALLFIVVTAARPWILAGKTSVGLWKMCTDKICVSIDDSAVFPNASSLKAIRAFMVLAIMAEIVSCVLAFLRAFKAVNFNLFIPILATAAAGPVCAIIGLIIFAFKYVVLGSLGWMFYFGWVSAIVGAAGVDVLFKLDKNQE